jgi:dTDP-4-dehydrorhamnose 3,5-epimerase
MSTVSSIYLAKTAAGVVVPSTDVEIPRCEEGIGDLITTASSERLIEGVGVDSIAVWPDDRGHFMEVLRIGHGLAAGFPAATSQVSATFTHAGVVKAFHYHLRQYDCWTVVSGMLQVALADLRRNSRTFRQRNTMYVGNMRPWQVLIPPGVAHGYKVIGTDVAVLVYVTSRFYDPSDECRIAYDDPRLNYDWKTQFK